MILHIKLTPKASRTEIQGWAEDANGNKILKCAVTAIPEKGKANTALIALLSKELHISKSNIQILKGETDRHKTIQIQGDVIWPKKLQSM